MWLSLAHCWSSGFEDCLLLAAAHGCNDVPDSYPLQAGLTKFLRIMQRKSLVTTATSAVTIPTPEVPR